MNILYDIKIWKELKQSYLEEVEMSNDIELNTWLANNAQNEINKLELLINSPSTVC